MRREIFLFGAALLFVAGNLTAAGLCGHSASWLPEIAAMISASAILVLLPLCLKHRRLCFLLFPLSGILGASCRYSFMPDESISILRESRSLRICGIITDGGLSSSGRPFLEVSLDMENTIIYNVPGSLEWTPGDTVYATVRCSKVENFSEDFDYVGYMREKTVFYTCFCGRSQDLEIRPCRSIPLRYLPASLRQRFSAAVDSALPSEEMAQTRAVVKALAYGYQDEIPAHIEESFKQSGAIHLLALSGMHLGLLYAVLAKLLSLAGNTPGIKRVRSVIIILTLWFYTVMTGCGVSILRAAVMFSIYEAGILAGRKRNGLNALSLSAIIITVADPSAPSGLSFQLSYAAMCAIFLIFPYLRGAVNVRSKPLVWLRDTCAMTVACQITTAPIILLNFGTFAFFSLLANLLCSPIVSIAMFLVPAVLIIPPDGGYIAEIPVRLLHLCIETFIRINATISNL